MKYSVLNDAGKPLDAQFEIDQSSIVFHSRGGAKGKNARNSEYEAGLRLLIGRLSALHIPVAQAFVDSSRVQSLPLEKRRILSSEEGTLAPEKIYGLLTSRMKDVGQSASSSGGNSTKRIRIEIAGAHSADELLAKLRAAPERPPHAELEKVTAEDLLAAVDLLLAGAEHRFGPSTDYDVLLDTGERLPPKAVFGLAATAALGFAVLPHHFTAGPDGPCFKALEAAGYKIVPKDLPVQPVPVEAEDPEWLDGTQKLRSHLKKERGSGLAAAKRAEFRRTHGRLFCERCLVDPVKIYGD